MRVPLGWLAEWIDLPRSSDALVERLTLAGLEIEGIERSGPDLTGVRVGLVLEREAHPNADRLSYCQVDLGSGEPVRIVCGAPNVRAGLKVAVASPGCVLPDGTKLKRSKIRGVVSEGMICSAQELGLGSDHAGILELDADAPLGAPLTDVVPAGETVLDLEITPNRGDWVSMLGIARETRAHFGGELRLPPCEPPEGERPAAADIRIRIDDREGCYRYVGRIVRGVSMGPSPDWLVQRLESAGLRSINVVVDVTNLVLLELGQPLHAFDLRRLRGAEVCVRAAAEGEKIVTLDEQTRELSPADLVIADAERPIAIAGVMGGAQTEVREDTVDLLIESAHFHPARVRRTARRLALHTDASYRFERGVDHRAIARAADRCARLIAELAGGEVSAGRVEAEGAPFEHCGEIALDPGHPTRLLGVAISRSEVIDCLARVDIEALPDGDQLRCRIPSYRNDISLPEDLVEEVARVHGYERIEPSLPAATLAPVSIPGPIALAERARDSLVASGLLETRSIPMLPPSDADALRLDPDDQRRRGVAILNPIVDSDSQLRMSLLPGLLRAVRRNLARQLDRIRLFEVGRSFVAGKSGELPVETNWAAAVLTGGEKRALWEPAERAPLFFEAKGIAERLIADLGFEPRFRAGGDAPYLHPGACGELRVGKRRVGCVGELHPEVAARFEIGLPSALLELELAALERLEPRIPHYAEVSAFPAARRDMAVLVADDQPAGEILDAIQRAGGPHLASLALFDRYAGAGIPTGRVSLAFRLVFQRLDRTLTDEEISKATDKIVKVLAQRFDGELR